MQNISEQDWMLFRNRLPMWQERYLSAAVASYQKILDSDLSASHIFCTLEDRLSQDRKLAAARLPYRMRRANVEYNLRALLRDGSISETDLEGFSEELRRAVTEIPPVQ